MTSFVGGVVSARHVNRLGEEVFFRSLVSLTLKQWLRLLHLWAKNDPVTSVADDIEVSRSSAIDSYQWLWEVCSTKLLQNPIELGGPGKIVQIDESLFRHKQPKVLINNCVSATGYRFFCFVFIPQHHRGRATTQEQWAFGLVDASHAETKALLGIWGASEVQSQLDGIVRNRTIFEKVAAQLREAGYERTWQQCKTYKKVQKLKAR